VTDVQVIHFYFSQRRKKNAEQIVGINLGNTLGPPELMSNDVISDASNAGSRPSSAADPKRSPDIPRTPHMKRKSISVDKPLYEPGKQRTSLAPKHKQSAKMDVARAMGIMGFNSSRWLECSQVNITFHNWDWSFCFNIKHFLIDLL
jgi:hypothetical protein